MEIRTNNVPELLPP